MKCENEKCLKKFHICDLTPLNNASDITLSISFKTKQTCSVVFIIDLHHPAVALSRLHSTRFQTSRCTVVKKHLEKQFKIHPQKSFDQTFYGTRVLHHIIKPQIRRSIFITTVEAFP